MVEARVDYIVDGQRVKLTPTEARRMGGAARRAGARDAGAPQYRPEGPGGTRTAPRPAEDPASVGQFKIAPPTTGPVRPPAPGTPFRGSLNKPFSDPWGIAVPGQPAAPPGQPAGGTPQNFDIYAAADKLLSSMGYGASPSGLADVGSTIATYNQAREAARQTAGVAQQQIGEFGQQGEQAVNEAYDPAAKAALLNVAGVQKTGQQLAAAPDENLMRAQEVAKANGIQISPEMLEQATQAKNSNQQLAAGATNVATEAAGQVNTRRAGGLEGSAASTQSARTKTQANLDAILSSLGIEQADKVSSIQASNAQMQGDYAAQRAQAVLELSQNINPQTGKEYTEQERNTILKQETSTDPTAEVLKELSEYDKKWKVGEEGGPEAGLGMSQIVRDSISVDPNTGQIPDLATAESMALEEIDRVNIEREKKGMRKLNRNSVLSRVRRGLAIPTDITSTTKS